MPDVFGKNLVVQGENVANEEEEMHQVQPFPLLAVDAIRSRVSTYISVQNK